MASMVHDGYLCHNRPHSNGRAGTELQLCSTHSGHSANGSGYPELDYESEFDLVEGPTHLSVDWHRERITRLQELMAERAIDGFVLRDAWNVVYFTGLYVSVTERPLALFIPAEGEPTIFAPYVDQLLLETWWVEDYETYFDFPHAEGDLDNVGERVDLLQWVMKGIARRGLKTDVLAFDRALSRAEVRRIAEVLPAVTLLDAPGIPFSLRLVKTPEELQLARVAASYGDKIMEYAIELVRQKGPELLDADATRMTAAYGEELMPGALDLDGRPHRGADCGVPFLKLRTGRTTQVVVVTRIGGMTVEHYRSGHIAPMSDHAKRMWEAHTEVTRLQAELSREGAICSDIARACLARYRERGMLDHAYHRPAHGQGMEGHQPPYIALGDRTVLKRGMCFSNEPGLYDVEAGIGYNHSNIVIVGEEGGEVPNRYPMDLDWLLINW